MDDFTDLVYQRSRLDEDYLKTQSLICKSKDELELMAFENVITSVKYLQALVDYDEILDILRSFAPEKRQVIMDKYVEACCITSNVHKINSDFCMDGVNGVNTHLKVLQENLETAVKKLRLVKKLEEKKRS